MVYSFRLHILVFFSLKITYFFPFSLLQYNLFTVSCGVELNSTTAEECAVDLLAPYLQFVKVEVKEENEITDIIDEEPHRNPLALETEEKSTFSNEDVEENVMKSECEEFEDFTIKEESAEVGTEAYGLNQEVLDERRIAAEKSERKESRIRAHVGKIKPHTCDECGKSYSRKYNLTRHLPAHTGEKPYKCDECGKFFSQSGGLSKHILIHTGDKPHKCDECGKSFSQKCNLNQHTLIHTGEKPHKCGECGKSFTQKSNLSKHILAHTGEKPHKCDECGKSFSRKCNLFHHILSHTKGEPHNCEECGKSFSQRGFLSQHILIHTGKKPRNYAENPFM